MASVKNLLEAKNLSRSFGGIRAVNKITFSLPKGQIRALIGPNGAGKTTFVSLLTGRIESDEGTVSFDGKDVTRLPAHKRIAAGMAYTFQITSVYPRLTLEENVALAVRRHIHFHPNQVRRAVHDALDKVGLADRAGQFAGNLAYGHQRLLEIAMGLAQKPKLLILDEPTQGLSDPEIAEFIALIRDISKDTTVLLIEHNMNVVMELAEFITVLDFGQILAEGNPEDIRANPAVQAAYLGHG